MTCVTYPLLRRAILPVGAGVSTLNLPLLPSKRRTPSKNTKPACRRVPFNAAIVSRSELRTGLDDGISDVELLEVVDEQPSQFLRRRVIGSRIGPSVTRVQQLGIDAGNSLGDIEIDDRQVLGFGTNQRT